MFCEFWKGLNTNKEQLSLLIAFVSLILVFYGLRSWRLQLNGTSRIKLAKSLLAQIYFISDLIHDARNTAFFEYEEPLDKKLDEKGKLSFQLENRLKPINEAFKELEKTYYESKVEWKFKSDKYFKDLRSIYMEYISAINTYVQYYDIQGNEKSEAFKIAFRNKDDEFAQRLDNLIANIDDWLRPKFQGWIRRKILIRNR
jgi:hypothetical protein